MSHNDLVEVYYDGIVDVRKFKSRDTVGLRFGDKVVWIMLKHLEYSWFDLEDKWKNTVMIQKWIVKTHSLESFIYNKEEVIRRRNEGTSTRL